MDEKETINTVITEAAKYGLAVLILTVLNVSMAAFIFFIWKQQIRERKELIDVIKDNTAAYTSLQGTISTLIQLFSSRK